MLAPGRPSVVRIGHDFVWLAWPPPPRNSTGLVYRIHHHRLGEAVPRLVQLNARASLYARVGGLYAGSLYRFAVQSVRHNESSPLSTVSMWVRTAAAPDVLLITSHLPLSASDAMLERYLDGMLRPPNSFSSLPPLSPMRLVYCLLV